MFKQTASHIPHEGNSEQLLSHAREMRYLGQQRQDGPASRLAVWTSIGINYSTYMPPTDEILKRYLLKFSKGSTAKVHEDDLGLLNGEAEDGGGCYVQASQSA